MELDSGEDVSSGARDPRLRDETTPLECLRVVVQRVDNVVEDFWWEIWIRHRYQRSKASILALILGSFGSSILRRVSVHPTNARLSSLRFQFIGFYNLCPLDLPPSRHERSITDTTISQPLWEEQSGLVMIWVAFTSQTRAYKRRKREKCLP